MPIKGTTKRTALIAAATHMTGAEAFEAGRRAYEAASNSGWLDSPALHSIKGAPWAMPPANGENGEIVACQQCATHKSPNCAAACRVVYVLFTSDKSRLP